MRLNAHAKPTLGLGVRYGTGASIFANSVVGVSDGDDLEIRYSDPTPGEGTQRASATVDTIAPTIGGFDPANDSFTTDDRFDSVFTVTDGGSGIFEDAEELEPLLERNRNTSKSYIRDAGSRVEPILHSD